MIELHKSEIKIGEDVADYYTSEVVKSGNSARINCPKKYLNKKVLVIILNENAKSVPAKKEEKKK